MKEGICSNCSEQGLLIQGLCGDCAPASYHQDYEAWWHSPEGQLERAIMAERLLSEFALEKGDAAPDAQNDGQGANNQK